MFDKGLFKMIGAMVVVSAIFIALLINLISGAGNKIEEDNKNRCKNIAELEGKEYKSMDFKCFLKEGDKWVRRDVY